MLCSNGIDCVHVCALPIEADGHNRFGSVSYSRHNFFGVDVVSLLVDINKHWLRADQRDHLAGSDESEGGSDDFVSRLNPQCHQRNEQGVSAIGNCQTVL
jgi:hypothetical protein